MPPSISTRTGPGAISSSPRPTPTTASVRRPSRPLKMPRPSSTEATPRSPALGWDTPTASAAIRNAPRRRCKRSTSLPRVRMLIRSPTESSTQRSATKTIARRDRTGGRRPLGPGSFHAGSADLLHAGARKRSAISDVVGEDWVQRIRSARGEFRMSIEPGQTLAQYQVVDALGAGGMGEVWRAEDSKLGREVALKVLPEEFAKDPERMARFEREAKVLASLNHPNIATLYGLESVSMARARTRTRTRDKRPFSPWSWWKGKTCRSGSSGGGAGGRGGCDLPPDRGGPRGGP